MDTTSSLIEQVRAAFANVAHPGPDDLTDSTYGEEPAALIDAFAQRTDWSVLTPEFLDQAPDGWSSALSFFSAPALRFYLPAYLVADLRGDLERCDPSIRLCAFVTPQSEGTKIAQTWGGGTMGARAREDFAIFDRPQVSAIVAYLWWKTETAVVPLTIEQALAQYWMEREDAAGP